MLEARNVTASYGRHRALDDVSARVDAKEICVVLGANGAGKTTLLKAIGGMVPTNGATDISLNGCRLNGLKTHEIVEAGVALVPEGRGIFADLTVEENLQLGAYAPRARAHEARNREMVFDLFPRLAERRRQLARTMSGGEQQMVAIGRALMSDPEILMLDEPSLGLSPLLCSDLFKSLKAIGRTGVGILLVEQNAKASLAIADRGYLLENGHIIGHDSAANLVSDPAVRRAYLGGGEAGDTAAASAPGGAPPTLSAQLFAAAFEAEREMLRAVAANAAAIQAAHVESQRRAAPVPGAFQVPPGSSGAQGASAAHPRSAAPGAGELARMAGDLARQAAQVMAAHIAARRGRAVPAPAQRSAPGAARRPAPPARRAAPAASELADMAAELASAAASIHAAHIAARRRAAERPGAGDKAALKGKSELRRCDKDPSKTCICAKSGEKRHAGVKCKYKKKSAKGRKAKK